MDIDNNGLPIHADATAGILPADLPGGQLLRRPAVPGTPNAPALASGATLPAAAHVGAGPARSRAGGADAPTPATTSQTLVQGLGGLAQRPAERRPGSPPEPGPECPRVDRRRRRSTSRCKLLRRRVRGDGDRQPGAARHPAARSEPGVSRATSRCSARCLGEWPAAAGASWTTFDTTLAALAARQHDLSADDRAAATVLRATIARSAPLNASFAPTKAFAAALIPGVEQLDPTIGDRAAVAQAVDRAARTERARRPRSRT